MSGINDLKKHHRHARRYFDLLRSGKFTADPEFDTAVLSAIDSLQECVDETSSETATLAGEIIPLYFTVDSVNGYKLFHDDSVMKKVWDIYNAATLRFSEQVGASAAKDERSSPGSGAPFRIACVTSLFSDFIAPCKALVNFATNLDREKFAPIVINTNQYMTHRRLVNHIETESISVGLRSKLAEAGVPFVNIPGQKDIIELACVLLDVCRRNSCDILLTNGSVFSFPDACVIRSGATLSSFDMHQGFPLYVDGLDAILHFNRHTRERQLRLWEQHGGKVIDYNFGVEVLPLPSSPTTQDNVIFLVTASNHLEDRFLPDFVAVVERLMTDFPNTHYNLIGPCVEANILKRFPSALHSRFHFAGKVDDPATMYAYFINSDIYLNEFPIGGGRVILEAMSAAIPVVAMRTGDLHVECLAADFVGDHEVPGSSPDDYYEMVKNLLTDTKKREKMGLAMRKRVEERYDISVNVKSLSKKLLDIHTAKLEK